MSRTTKHGTWHRPCSRKTTTARTCSATWPGSSSATRTKPRRNLFRVAGEEFLAVLPGFDRNSAVTLATEIVAAVSALQIPFRRLDKPLPKTLHVNVAVLTLDPESVELSIGLRGLGDPIHATAAGAIYQEKLRRNLPAGVVAVV